MRITCRMGCIPLILLISVLVGCTEEPSKSKKIHTITFDSKGGTPTPPSQQLNQGDTVKLPPPMSRAGYTFVGWYADGQSTPYIFSTPVMANLTLSARWTVITYTITFNADGGTPTPPSQQLNQGDTVKLPPPMSRAGYTFEGWYADGQSTPYIFSTLVMANLTLSARWTAITYTVTFNADGGTPTPPSQQPNQGDTVKLPPPMSRAGYTFVGWYADGQSTPYIFSTPVMANLTLSARWNLLPPPTPVIMTVTEGSYLVFDVSVDQAPLEDITLTGGFSIRGIINYVNPEDYTAVFEYSSNSGRTWQREANQNNIKILASGTSVRVRVPTSLDNLKEVSQEKLKVGFSLVSGPLGYNPGVIDSVELTINDDDVAINERLEVNNEDGELMIFDVNADNEFTVTKIVDSVQLIKEKEIIDTLYVRIINAVSSVANVSPVAINRFIINYNQPSTVGSAVVLGYVEPKIEIDIANVIVTPEGNRLFKYNTAGWTLSLNAVSAFRQIYNSWAEQLFNQDGQFGATIVHEYGHLLTLNANQARYLGRPEYINIPCADDHTYAVGNISLCFNPNSYASQFLANFYDSVAVSPISRPELVAPVMVTPYASTIYPEDLAESFLAYVGTDKSQIADYPENAAAYLNKMALYKGFEESVDFKDDIIATGLKIRRIGEAAKIRNALVVYIGGGTKNIQYGGREGCVRPPINH